MNYQQLCEELSGRDLIVVDIQPTYEKYIHAFDMDDFTEYLNETEFNSIFYLYNGPDMGFEDWDDIGNWLVDNGLEEDKVHEMKSFEKGYAFFRSFMDLGMDEDDLIKLLQYMYSEKIYDSRDISEEDWDALNINWEYNPDGDMVNIPDVLFELERYHNPIICGGGRDECLAEVVLCMKVLEKPYELLERFVY